MRDQPGWVTFSIDGRHAYPSTGEVFDVKTKKLIASLKDETGRDIGSEKLLEIVFDGTKPVRNGDQFGVGTKRKDDRGDSEDMRFTPVPEVLVLSLFAPGE